MKRIRHRRVMGNDTWVAAALAILLFLPSGLRAQRFPFHNLAADDGLPNAQVTSMAQDKAGFLWIGTLGGIARYDGKTFKNYTTREGLPHNAVYAVTVDSQGNVWAGTQSGLALLSGKTFTHFGRPQPGIRDLNNTQQIEISGDTTWYRAHGDVYYLTRGKMTYFNTPGPAGYITAILLAPDGMWVGKDGIIYHRTGNRWDTVRFNLPPGQPLPQVTKLYSDKDGTVWIGTNAGLYRTEKGRPIPYALNTGDTGGAFLPAIYAFTEDKAGTLWLGTANGVVHLTDNLAQYYNRRNGLADKGFTGMFTDAMGNVWMGSDGQGVYRYSGAQFAALDESLGMAASAVTGFAATRHDSLFVGTADAGLYLLAGGKLSIISFPENPVPSITTLYHTHAGKLWIGSRGKGLWSYQNEIFRQYEAPDRNFPGNTIHAVYEEPDGRLWIGFPNGVILFEHDSFKTIPVRNMPGMAFLRIGTDSTLIATGKRGNLLLYTAGNVENYTTNTALDSTAIQCMMLKGNTLWTGTTDNGLIGYHLDTRRTQIINRSKGLSADAVVSIVASRDGTLWAGTPGGAYQVRISDTGTTVTAYGKVNGLAGTECMPGAAWAMPDSSVWLGTSKGAFRYLPHAVVVPGGATAIVLESVKVAGVEDMPNTWYDSADHHYGIPWRLRLPTGKNNLTFTFQGVALSGGQLLQYRYRMDGLDAPWSEWSPANTVNYPALPPGHYVLHVQCQAGEGQNTPELTYPFEIITPVQSALWFKLAILGACVVLGILLQYMVSASRARRQRRLTQAIADEQRTVRWRTEEDFHGEIGNKVTRINLLAKVLKSKLPHSPETLKILGQIEENAGQLYDGSKDILWSLKPEHSNIYDILNHIKEYGQLLFKDSSTTAFTFDGIEEKWRRFILPMDMNRTLVTLLKEAISNSHQHAGATKVWVEATIKNRTVLQVVIRDNGRGFDIQTVKRGTGIKEMYVRAGRLGGRLYIDSRPNKGAIINFTFKLPDRRY